MKRVVVTGAPGGGKTAALEVARRTFCEHVGFAPESAGIVFRGGFPRESREHAVCAAQRAIFYVQREIESLFDDRTELALVVCDRGTLDCAAYWPRSERDFYQDFGTTHEAELARYAAVIHLRPPPATSAVGIDARIERVWSGHPRRFFVEHPHDFFASVAQVLSIIEGQLSCSHLLAAKP